jgi:hypothetical protein
MKKNDGELVQNCDTGYGDGRNDAPTPTATIVAPTAAKPMFIFRSTSPDRTRSTISPAAAPASTKPAQGKSVNVVRPGHGLKYHSIGSGRAARLVEARISGVANPKAIATAPSTASRMAKREVRPHTAAASTIAGPMMFRMSTLRMP